MNRPVTLITGSRTGIGRALAEHYLECGHDVVGGSRDETDLSHDHYTHFNLDVADEKAVKAMFGWLRKDIGRLDHLVNNAGVASMNHALLTPMSTVRDVMGTNFSGTFLFCREAAKLMRRAGSGRIVNLSSVAVPFQLEGEAVYAASKAAVVSLTQILAREFAEFGVTVNAVGPTPMSTGLVAGVPPQKIESIIRRQAVRRVGTIDDVLNVIDFFFRRESDFITGQCLYLGGP